MEQTERESVVSIGHWSSGEWAKLTRKLRWIGLEDEARRLEQAVSTLPAVENDCVSAGPLRAD